MKQYLLGLALASIGLVSPVVACENGCEDQCCDNEFFDGFYIGGNLGWATHQATRYVYYHTQSTGFVGGLQLGRDWQCDGFVYGLVWDFDGATNSFSLKDDTGRLKLEMDWFTTFRARAGWSICNTLGYVTAGAIATHVRTSAYYSGSSRFDHYDKSFTRWGWIAGVGIERQVCDNLTLGGDVTYSAFSTKNGNIDDWSWANSENIWAARFIFNHRIDDLCCPW